MSLDSQEYLLQDMQKRLIELKNTKEIEIKKNKDLGDKLHRVLKNPPKRPHSTISHMNDEMKALEYRRSTTSISLNEEKQILKDISILSERKKQIEQYHEFQQYIETLKSNRLVCHTHIKTLDEQIQQLQNAIEKLELAIQLNCDVKTLVTMDISVPKDRLGNVIGRQFTRLHQLEKEYQVLITVDRQLNILRITSTPKNTLQVKIAIENITLATSHSIGLHPDTLKVLMLNKFTHMKTIEKECNIKMDLNYPNGVITVFASPTQAKLLEKAIQKLTEKKMEISIPQNLIPKLIGKKGESIQRLVEDTGVLVEVDKVSEIVRLVGETNAVMKAQDFINNLMTANTQREIKITIDTYPDMLASIEGFQIEDPMRENRWSFFLEFLMLHKAEQLKYLREGIMNANLSVQKHLKAIQIIGNQAQMEALHKVLFDRIKLFASSHWCIQIPNAHALSVIIGKKGSMIQELEEYHLKNNDKDKRAGDKNNRIRIDIEKDALCVFGDRSESIETTKKKILEIIASNQKSTFITRPHIIAILQANHRSALRDIEMKSENCKVILPNNSARDNTQVIITLIGTSSGIDLAKFHLQTLEDTNLVKYLPLDDDEVAKVIGKKGETVTELERTTKAKLHVTKHQLPTQRYELEMIGTHDEIASAEKALDDLLQTQHRRVLQFDEFSASCLIGKKGERITALRALCSNAVIDVFAKRGQIRIKALSEESLNISEEHVRSMLQDMTVVETVHNTVEDGTKPVSLKKILEKEPAVALRLAELEAKNSHPKNITRVITENEQTGVRIRGMPLGITSIKDYVSMIIRGACDDSYTYIETIGLPTLKFASVFTKKLVDASSIEWNDNAARICRETGVELSLQRKTTSHHEAVLLIVGNILSNVYKAREQLYKVLEFYYPQEIRHFVSSKDNSATELLVRMFDSMKCLKTNAKVDLTLLSLKPISIRVWTAEPDKTDESIKVLSNEEKMWEDRHNELVIPSWLVPALVGKNGEMIKKLSEDSNNVKMQICPQNVSNQFQRLLTFFGDKVSDVTHAKKNVQSFISDQYEVTTILHIDKTEQFDLLIEKIHTPTSLQVYLTNPTEVLIFGKDVNAREELKIAMTDILSSNAIEHLKIPKIPGANSLAGQLIGKGGTHIRTLQKEYPGVTISIEKNNDEVRIKGPKDLVVQVKRIMRDKIQELERKEADYTDKKSQKHTAKAIKFAKVNEHTDVILDNSSIEEVKSVGTAAKTNHINDTSGSTVPGGNANPLGNKKLNKVQRRRMRKREQKELENSKEKSP